MKLFFAVLVASLVFVGGALAEPTLKWNVENGSPDGFILSYKKLADLNYVSIGITPGSTREYDLAGLNLDQGVRYEFFLQATESGSESAESDHIRYTMPAPSQIIEMQASCTLTIQLVP